MGKTPRRTNCTSKEPSASQEHYFLRTSSFDLFPSSLQPKHRKPSYLKSESSTLLCHTACMHTQCVLLRLAHWKVPPHDSLLKTIRIVLLQHLVFNSSRMTCSVSKVQPSFEFSDIMAVGNGSRGGSHHFAFARKQTGPYERKRSHNEHRH